VGVPVAVAGVFVALAAAATLAGFVVARQSTDVRRKLLIVCAVALALRISLAVVLDLLGSWHTTERGAILPDEGAIDYAARLIAAGDTRSPVLVGGSLYTVWLLVASSAYEVWNSLLALKLLNALLGTLLVVPVFLLGRELYSVRAGLFAAWGIALFPTAIVWSSLALREPLIALLLTTILLAGVLLVKQGSSTLRRAATAGAVVSLLVLSFTRAYMVPLMLALLGATAATAAGRQRALAPILYAGAVLVLTAALVIVMPNGLELTRSTVKVSIGDARTIFNPLSDPPPEVSSRPRPCFDFARRPGGARRGIALASGVTKEARPPPPPREAEARPDQGTATADPSDSQQSVGKKGLVRASAIAVLAGRPVWRLDTFYFLLQPGLVVWWILLPLVVAGAVVLLSRRRFPQFVLLVGFLSAVMVFLAYSGQGIRHHYMLEPVALAIAAVGAVSLLESRQHWARRLTAVACVTMGVAATASVAFSRLLPC
jgi:4-amino-4-deoxy-L-arabinose transferase-like glycosyltransferase